jgi:hypothetical protein
MLMNVGRVARAAIDPDHDVVVLQRAEGSLEAWDILAKNAFGSHFLDLRFPAVFCPATTNFLFQISNEEAA